ncbi:MAG: lamin tail domain-containing protein, partial [Verrucomicrobiota bacterium]
GPFDGNLANGGGTLRFRNPFDAVLLELDYSDEKPWPVTADGVGHSLVLAAPDYGEQAPKAWRQSNDIGGSPGAAILRFNDPLTNMVINEILAHTDDPEFDYVELFNRGPQPVTLTGCWLTDSASSNRFQIPPTVVPGFSFVSFHTNNAVLGFELSAMGETLYLISSNENRVIDAVRFEAQQNGVALGRYPDGAPGFQPLENPTLDASNDRILTRDIVINEIMFHSISADRDDEYVELHNIGAAPIDLGMWRFTAGIDYIIPSNTVIQPGGFLVVARDAARMMTNYPHLNPANCIGNFSGRLSDRGERLALSKPDNLSLPNQDFVVMDEVIYSDGWGEWIDGGGSSLELIDPRSDNRMGMNWKGSDESQKAPWTTVNYTGTVDNGSGSLDAFRIFMLQGGECVVDNVDVHRDDLTSYVQEDFEGGIGGWTPWGNHVRSGLSPNGGFGNSRALHIRASGKGDTGIPSGWTEPFWNRIDHPIGVAPGVNDTVIIQARVRWVAGWPHLSMAFKGYWLEAPVGLDLPTDLGSPGQTNSCHTANSGPAIREVQHVPVLPAAGENVKVTCRVSDPDGLGSLSLSYRVDPSAVLNTVPMVDDGSGVDDIASDGIYSGQLPGQAAGAMIAFQVIAHDSLSASNRFPQPAGLTGVPDSECLVRFGDNKRPGAFETYHLWLNAANVTRWTSISGGQSRYSNEPIDLTFVCGNYRAIYGGTGRWRGLWRPYSTPVNSGAYSVSVPKTDRFLCESELKLDQPGQTGSDSTRQTENYTFWMARKIGEPAPNIRFVHVYCNGNYRSVLHDLQTPSLDFCRSWFGDDDPFVFKNVGWVGDPFDVYEDADGRKKQSRYRWSLRKRRTNVPSDDFSPVFKLADAFATPDDELYEQRVASMVDIRSWSSYFALSAVVGGWDHYGFSHAHNMFVYIPDHLKSHMFIYDMDHVLRGSTTGGLFPGWVVPSRMYTRPAFRRIYWSVLKDALDCPFHPDIAHAYIDQWYDVFQREGVPATSPDAIKSWISGRYSHLVGQLNSVAATFEITSNGGADFSSGTTPVTLTGTAPIDVASIHVNGSSNAVTFTSETAWSMEVALQPGANLLFLEGYTRTGVPSSNAFDAITVTYTGPGQIFGDDLVINEIMYNALDPFGDFIEIHNRSTTDTYHLGGLRLNGVDFTFPQGTFIGPEGFVVVTENTAIYAAIYTNIEVVVGTYDGSLDNGGENLQLLQPNGTNWIVLDDVRYDNLLPWPAAADGSGPSLQLIDPAQDNTIVGNWGVDTGAILYTPGATNSVLMTLPPIPTLRINEIQPYNLNTVQDNAGDFDPWIEIDNYAPTGMVSLDEIYLTDDLTRLTNWNFPAGHMLDAATYRIVWADAEPGETVGTDFHAGFALSRTGGVVALVWLSGTNPIVLDSMNYHPIGPNQSYGLDPADPDEGPRILFFPTPGGLNDASDLPAGIRINEYMADNDITYSNSVGDYEDWFELYNAGS